MLSCRYSSNSCFRRSTGSGSGKASVFVLNTRAWPGNWSARPRSSVLVKSSCPLCPGRHTCYNGRDKGSRSREGELTPKTRQLAYPEETLKATGALLLQIHWKRVGEVFPHKLNVFDPSDPVLDPMWRQGPDAAPTSDGVRLHRRALLYRGASALQLAL
ncbi:hypothetical protein TIFTF001_034066 [Ficus carica]|uniref:Uncharacterized protein n=1 Tax=Ficus carica TaxID=3494 RepID=A0AA88E0G7_FICCA|nr:hypothetical protein TIFTF001_034066 [Ficus carica]